VRYGRSTGQTPGDATSFFQQISIEVPAIEVAVCLIGVEHLG